ncbi:uncharacterized protein [Clytia hemisphaerica]|uniref:Cnidarian restricted protein n=1 Tax=Clytia hemisphaerica TaxID=252671 RepID=A0A7M5WX21_9CNID
MNFSSILVLALLTIVSYVGASKCKRKVPDNHHGAPSHTVIKEEQPVTSGDLKLSLPVLSAEWNVKIKFLITGFPVPHSKYCAIFRMSNGDVYGTRTPAISVNTETSKLIVASAVSGNANRYKLTSFQTNTWYDVEVDQSYKGNGIYQYSIIVNGDQIASEVNTQAIQFYNVGVYAGHPFPSQLSCTGVISYLKVTNFL